MNKTVIQVFEKISKDLPEVPAYSYKEAGKWHDVTWKEYWKEVMNFANGLIQIGFQAKDSLCILSANNPRWSIADLAAIAAGGVPAGIYPTSSCEQCCYIISHSNASILVVENKVQLDKVYDEVMKFDHIKGIILIKGNDQRDHVYSWGKIDSFGRQSKKDTLYARIAAQTPQDLATLVYTSGTTSNPKAVMLSHINLTWTAACVVENHLELTQNDVMISYLPLSHIAEQMTTIHAPLCVGYKVSYAESVEKLAENLKEVRPTLFLGVPRVWEKIQAKMMEQGAKTKGLKKKLVTWAKKVGLEHAKETQFGRESGLSFKLAEKLVFSKVKKALGLDRCRLQITAAAPISEDTLNFFFSLNVPVYEIFGMSESTGPATISLPNGRYRIGKVGVPIHGTEIKIAEDGEILIRGPHIFMGYLHNPEATAETLDKDGWLHSGDLGLIDQDGYIKISGRKKNLIITAGGENISTEMIEGKYNNILGVEHVVAVGDRKKYLSALITLNPATALVQSKKIGSPAKSVEELACCPKFNDYLMSEVEGINKSVARVQTLKRLTILPKQFSEDSGELTPTMKVKRNIVLKKYSAEIQSMYQ